MGDGEMEDVEDGINDLVVIIHLFYYYFATIYVL
jgi:hypothetical protein